MISFSSPLLPLMLAGLLAFAGAAFGVVAARCFWAEDLRHAQELNMIWKRTEAHMQERIDILEREMGRR